MTEVDSFKNNDNIYWNVQFKHREKGKGKDIGYMLFLPATDRLLVLEKACQKAREDGYNLNGEYRVYIYEKKI